MNKKLKMNKLYRYILTAAILTSSLINYAQFKDDKTTEKSSKFSQTGKVMVNNRHGNIQVISWAKDSIRVKAHISGESKSLANLSEALSKTTAQINLSFTNAEINTVVYESGIEKSINDIKKIAGAGTNIKINYTIYAPKSCKLMLSNKYGDILLDNHDGVVIAKLNHGNLRANELPQLNNLHCTFGNIYIRSAETFTGSFYFSDLDIESVGQISMDAKSSTLEIGKIDELTISSSNDEIIIDEINHFNFNGNLSKIKIGSLGLTSMVNMKYGKFRVRRIESTVCKFNAQSSRTTIDLGFAPNVNFRVSGYQEDVDFSSTNPLSHVNTSLNSFNGYYGQNPEAQCVYMLNGQKSKIYFR